MRLRRRPGPAAPPVPDRTHLHLEQIQAVADRYACDHAGHRRGTPRSWALVGRGS